MFERVICLILGYLLGSVIQAGYWYGRLNHIDIRKYGSGNAGTTNVMRTLGRKAGIITYLFDALKPIICTVIIHFVFGNKNGNELLLIMYGGLGVVVGHNFPFYLKFKGGKGIAASSGDVLSLLFYPANCWAFTVLGAVTSASVTYISKYVSLGSLVAISLWFIEFVIWGCAGWLPLEGNVLYESYGVVFVITLLAFIRHSGNIKRLINGTDRKIGQKKTEEANG